MFCYNVERLRTRVFVGFHLLLENKPNAKKLPLGKVQGSSGSTYAGTDGNNRSLVTTQPHCNKSLLNLLVLVNKCSSRAGLFWLRDLALYTHDAVQYPFSEISRTNSVPLRIASFAGVPGNEQVFDLAATSVRPGRELKPHREFYAKNSTESKIQLITRCKLGFVRGIRQLILVIYKEHHLDKTNT